MISLGMSEDHSVIRILIETLPRCGGRNPPGVHDPLAQFDFDLAYLIELIPEDSHWITQLLSSLAKTCHHNHLNMNPKNDRGVSAGISRLDPMLFMLAGASNMTGATATNPVDVIKTRLQLDNELACHTQSQKKYNGLVRGTGRIVAEEGIAGLYKGWVPSMMRESSYSTIRMGAYEPIKWQLGAVDPAHTPLWKKIVAGAISGAIGSAIANPTDLVRVRLQAQGSATSCDTVRHNGALGAFRDIYKLEGMRGLWTGCGPTIVRAMIITSTQIPTYDHMKHTLLNYKIMDEGIPLHIVSSMAAGLMCAATSSPVDTVKTRIMNQHQIDGVGAKYTSPIDALKQCVQVEGIRGLYKGFLPNWLRLGPHTIVTFFVFEQLRSIAGIRPI